MRATEDRLRARLSRDPTDVAALTDYAELALALGRPAEAATLAQTAIGHAPDGLSAWIALGTACRGLGRPGPAAWAEACGLALDPAHHALLNNLGLSRADGVWLRRALRVAPDSAGIACNLGEWLHRSGRLRAARAAFRRALALDPALLAAINNLGGVARDFGDAADQTRAAIRAQRLSGDRAALASNRVLAAAETDDPDYRAIAQTFAMRGPVPPRPGPRPAPRGRLRIGYLSPDFRRHSVAYFLEPLIAAHDRSAVMVHCYSDVIRPDAVTTRFRTLAERWTEVAGCDDATLAARIAGDGIDVLVDLAGHTHGNRLGVFARRPAPVQVSWLGYNATTGLAQIDWRLIDRWMAPPGAESEFVEPLWRFDQRPCHCFRPDPAAPPPGKGPLARGQGPVFGSFNHLHKLDAATIAVWSRLLHRVPAARLLLKASQAGDPAVQEVVRGRFAAQGVAAGRIAFLPYAAAVGDHLVAYDQIDLMLDPLGYNGTTSSCEGLWQGVPLVTLSGRRALARVGHSLLAALGLDDLVAPDADTYVEIAAAQVAEGARLADLRAGLRARMAASPLRDEAGFARTVEGALTRMADEMAI